MGVASLVGAIAIGSRPRDPLIRAVAAGGFAAVLCILLLRAWNSDREAERAQRHQEHVEMVQLLRDQHREDLEERRHQACIAAQLTDTVRAAIWRERPRERGPCP